MIDVEDDVLDYVYQAVAPLIPEGGFRSVYVPSASAFPCATLMEDDNTTDAGRMDSSGEEKYAVLIYEADVYAMSKAECRTVMKAIDESMTSLNFTRTTMRFISNLADETIFRYRARWRGKANADKTFFRAT